jgi:hypothetical protein
MSIREKAMLVSLHTSYWTNRASDAAVVDKLVLDTKAEADVHRYSKMLLPRHAVAGVQSVRNAARKYVFDETLPWANAGLRLLPAAKFAAFSEKMRDYGTQYEREVAAFIKAYPQLKADARKRLGDLFNEGDFPSPESMRSRFKFAPEFIPIPSGTDFRIDLSDAERKEIERAVEARVEAAARDSMRSLVARLEEKVRDLTERLKDKDAVLTSTMFKSIDAEAADASVMNVLDDKRVASLNKAAADLVSGAQVDAVRNDEKLRKKMADKADALLARMVAYTGGTE